MRFNGDGDFDGAVTAINIIGTAFGANTGDQTSIVGITGTLAQFNTALTGADFATGGGTATGTNTGDQTVANTSDATSHTVTLSASGGSVKLVEGSNVTLTTTGTAGDGIVTIASTSVATTPAGADGYTQYNNGGVFGATDCIYDDAATKHGFGDATPASKVSIKSLGSTSATTGFGVKNSSGTQMILLQDDGKLLINRSTTVYSGQVDMYQSAAASSGGIKIENVGVGNSTAEFRFHNDAGLGAFVGIGASTFSSTTYASRLVLEGDQNGVSYLSWASTGDHRWYTGTSSSTHNERMRLNPSGNFLINTTSEPTVSTGSIIVGNGTAPTSNPANQFTMYSFDQSPGVACPHFVTEDNKTIKLFQGAALTAQDTTITHTAPGTPDFAIQTVQLAGFGFASADEGNTVLQVIANLQTRMAELEARLNVSTGHGLIA